MLAFGLFAGASRLASFEEAVGVWRPAWVEVRPDGEIPGFALRRGEPYVIRLQAHEREGAGVYSRVRVLNVSSGS